MRLLLELGEFNTYVPREIVEANNVSSVLCSDMAVKQIDEPFVAASESRDDWAL
jgi:hypothetical protein